MERNDSVIQGLFCVTVVVLLGTGRPDRAIADESQTSIGEVPLCDLGTGTFEGVPGGLDPTLEYNPAGGTFILTARATDDLGAAAEHSVTITIRSGQ